MPNDHGEKSHGDKLEPTSENELRKQPTSGGAPALPDSLGSADLDPQTEGSLKIHGDKLEPHS